MAEVIRKFALSLRKELPSCLTTIKNDQTKNTKQTNWNFIW